MSESNTSLSSDGPNNKLRNPNAQLQSINGIMRQAAAGRPSSSSPNSSSCSTKRPSCPSADALPYRHKFRSIVKWARRRLPDKQAAGAKQVACHMPHATCQSPPSGYPDCHLMRELPPMPMSTLPSIMLSSSPLQSDCLQLPHGLTVGGVGMPRRLQLRLTFRLALNLWCQHKNDGA